MFREERLRSLYQNVLVWRLRVMVLWLLVYQKWLDVMEKSKVSWVNWSVSDSDKLFHDFARAKAAGNWTDDLIQPWGKMVKLGTEI